MTLKFTVILIVLVFIVSVSPVNIEKVPKLPEKASSQPVLKTESTKSRLGGDEGIVLVGTLDGKVNAVDESSGDIKWSLDTGGPLLQTSFGVEKIAGVDGTGNGDGGGIGDMPNENEPIFVPGVDGSLFIFSPDGVMRRLPFTAQELVSLSPFTTDDGLMYLGSKRTSGFSLDPSTGITGAWRMDTDASYTRSGASEDQCPNDASLEDDLHNGNVLLFRSEYSVKVVDSVSGKQRWNVSISQFTESNGFPGSPSSSSSSVIQRQGKTPSSQVVTTSSGALQMYRPTTTSTTPKQNKGQKQSQKQKQSLLQSQPMWETVFSAPAVSIHNRDGDNDNPRLLSHSSLSKDKSKRRYRNKYKYRDNSNSDEKVRIGMFNGQIYARNVDGDGSEDRDGGLEPTTAADSSNSNSRALSLLSSSSQSLEYSVVPWNYNDADADTDADGKCVAGSGSGSAFCPPSTVKGHKGSGSGKGRLYAHDYDNYNDNDLLSDGDDWFDADGEGEDQDQDPETESDTYDVDIDGEGDGDGETDSDLDDVLDLLIDAFFLLALPGVVIIVSIVVLRKFVWPPASISSSSSSSPLVENQNTNTTTHVHDSPDTSNSDVKPNPKNEQENVNEPENENGNETIVNNNGHTHIQIGQLSFDLSPPNVLGTGSQGTVVYSGQFAGRKVAVKRMLKTFYDVANSEMNLLLESDEHMNIIRYFSKEESGEFVYLALELCESSLLNVIEAEVELEENKKVKVNNTANTTIPIPYTQMIQYCKDLLRGLEHLHSLNIVHRDLKPHNILINKNNVLKISDMGLARKLDPLRESFDTHRASGSVGWQAPEVMSGGRMTKSVDVFAAGCLIYYILSSGKHPFGSQYEREHSILLGKQCDLMSELQNPEAVDLIERMIHPDPDARPTISACLSHPLFWSSEKQLQFLSDASDRLEVEKTEAQIVSVLEVHSVSVLLGGWDKHIDDELIDNLGKYRKYNFQSIRDILRVIRNKKNHFRDLPTAVQSILGDPPHGYLSYFKKRFPSLLIRVYKHLGTYARHELSMSAYYTDGAGDAQKVKVKSDMSQPQSQLRPNPSSGAGAVKGVGVGSSSPGTGAGINVSEGRAKNRNNYKHKKNPFKR